MSRGIWWVGAPLTDSPGSPRREDSQGVTGTWMKMSAINTPLITWGAPKLTRAMKRKAQFGLTVPSPNSILPELSSHRPEGSLNDVLKGLSHLARSESPMVTPSLRFVNSHSIFSVFRRGAAPSLPGASLPRPATLLRVEIGRSNLSNRIVGFRFRERCLKGFYALSDVDK